MASNYYTNYPEKKHTAGKPPKLRKAGGTPSMPRKKGPFPGAGGRKQRDRSLGFPKVYTYNHQDGL